MSLLEVSDLSVTFGGWRGATPVEAVKHASFTLDRGETLALAPRELVRIGVEPALGVAEADQVQQFEGADPRRRRRHVLVYEERLGDLLFERVQRVQ